MSFLKAKVCTVCVVEGVFVFFKVLRHKNDISKIRPSGKLSGAGQLLGEGKGLGEIPNGESGRAQRRTCACPRDCLQSPLSRWHELISRVKLFQS